MRILFTVAIFFAVITAWSADSGLGPSGAGGGAVLSVNTRTGAIVLNATDIPTMVASGGSHAGGAVPDPPSGSGTAKYLREDATWGVPAGTGAGSVTSVAMTVPTEMSISGSPITTSGTLALTMGTEAANKGWFGPTSGGAATPTFRLMVAADLPATGSDFQFFRTGIGGAPVLSSYQRSDEIDIWDDFLGVLGGTTGMWAASVVGGTVTTTGTAATNLRPGELDFASGSGTTDRISYRANVGYVIFGNGTYYWGSYQCVPTLSVVAQEYSLQIGFCDTVNAVDSTDGAYFAYDRLTAGDFWEAVTANSGARTKTTGSVGIVAGQYYKLEIVANAAGTSIAFKVDGTTIATHTTNIPTGTGRGAGPGFMMNKSAGSSAITGLRVDCVRIQHKMTTDNRNF